MYYGVLSLTKILHRARYNTWCGNICRWKTMLASREGEIRYAESVSAVNPPHSVHEIMPELARLRGELKLGVRSRLIGY